MRRVIALDIGGTKIEGAVFDENYKIILKKRVFFDKPGTDSTVGLPRKKILEMVCLLINELRQKPICGIGVSIPDVINSKGAIVGTSKISSLSNFGLGAYLKKKYKCTVTVNNDADCFAYGEAKLGAGKGHANVVGIIFGTGIGSGIVINHKLYIGTTGSCGEFGHNIVNPAGPEERSGLFGTVESYAGGPDLVRNYLRLGGQDIGATPRTLYSSKEPAAKKAVAEALTYLSMGIASIMNILNPGIIVVGGGQSNRQVYKKLNMLTRKYCMDGLRKHVKIVKNKLGDSAGIYGAAALAFGK